MSAVKINDNIYWVGAIDYDVRNFHGYLTPYGTTYNAYLILDDRVTLVDTVKATHTQDMLRNISEVIDPARIDVHISNHVEPDHSGALPELRRIAPNAAIYTSPNGLKGLTAYYPSAMAGADVHVVKTGETLRTGQYEFSFVLMPMVHWPDSMTTYLPGAKTLFCNDALGQHIASLERFDDEIGRDRLLERAGDYYANIVLPFGMQVQKLLGEITPLSVDTVCPSHGVVLRSYIGDMLDRYAAWARNETDQLKAVIVYDTMWGATRDMAESLALELRGRGMRPELVCLKTAHISTAMASVLDASFIAVGSPTLNRNLMPQVAAFLTYMRGLAPKNRKGLAFGSHGWSGEGASQVETALGDMGFELEPTRKTVWRA